MVKFGLVRLGLVGCGFIEYSGGQTMNRKDAIDCLVKAVEGMDYGRVLGLDEIGNIIEQKYGTAAYSDILQAARKRLIAAGHMIVNVRGIGYKVCPPDNYTDEGVRQMRVGARRIDAGAKILNHAPVSDMSPAARESYNRVHDGMMRLQAAVAGRSVEIHMLSARENPLRAAQIKG